jgi:hypothetical protein
MFLYFFAALGALGVIGAMLMGVTVVGVCRYGDRYSRFFERLKTLGALATIKEMSRVYFDLLNKFLGPNVGLKQQGVLEKSKFIGLYIEHLLLFYWISATVLVLSFRPVEPSVSGRSSLLQAAAFVTLLTANVTSDALSLLWTKRCIALLVVPDTPITLKKIFVVLAQDILVAAALMLLTQIISNGLYAVQIGRHEDFFDYMFSIKTAFKPYAAIDQSWSTIQFPGQLLITGTTAFLPSLAFYIVCLIILILMPFYRLLIFILGTFDQKIGDGAQAKSMEGCSQLAFIGSLAGVGGFAMAAGRLLVDTWALIPPK